MDGFLKGRILAYSAAVSAGVIETQHGERHLFLLTNWQSRERGPETQDHVRFRINGGLALEISRVEF